MKAAPSTGSTQALYHQDLGNIGAWTPNVEDVYELQHRPQGDRLRFIWSQKPAPTGASHPAPQSRPKTRDLNIHIEQDFTRVQITLGGNTEWYWHETRAITTDKRTDENLYFNLEYLVGGIWKDNATGAQCKTVRFGARKLSAPGHELGFNLNVLLQYSNDHHLPISIDPDIQNPGTRP